MQLSVIIPTLNEAPRIATAIERAWALQPYEVIVSDGGSGDGTVELASKCASQVIASPRGRGPQQNAGAQQASGEVLLFLHADTWLDLAGVTQIVKAMQQGARCGAFLQKIESRGVGYRLLERGNAFRVKRLGVAYGDQGLFFQRSFFESLGGFPAVPLMEDLKIMREVRKTCRPALLPGPIHVGPRRWQQTGILRQTLRNWSLLWSERKGTDPRDLAARYNGSEPTSYDPHADPTTKERPRQDSNLRHTV